MASDQTEEYDECRLFVDGLGSAEETVERLLGSQNYQRVDQSLRVTDGVWAAVRKNKSMPRDAGPDLIAGTPSFLTWPVTVEVFRDEGVDDAAMLAAVRKVVADLRELRGEVVVSADFEDEL
ncbi:hypothetical protein ACH495_08425 [Micromonospora sp. NPDC018662]|uniref:hypothetical protein n=1 Tax=Micromonospora sp. NPDC018662 TaxID=3364238 RepID=UPI0037B26BDC